MITLLQGLYISRIFQVLVSGESKWYHFYPTDLIHSDPARQASYNNYITNPDIWDYK